MTGSYDGGLIGVGLRPGHRTHRTTGDVEMGFDVNEVAFDTTQATLDLLQHGDDLGEGRLLKWRRGRVLPHRRFGTLEETHGDGV